MQSRQESNPCCVFCMGMTQTEIYSELTDLRHRLEFYQEHVFCAPHAEEALARQLAENARQQVEILELRKPRRERRARGMLRRPGK